MELIEINPKVSASLSMVPRKVAKEVHCKKRLAIFPSPAGMSLTKLSLPGNNKIVNLPLQCAAITYLCQPPPPPLSFVVFCSVQTFVQVPYLNTVTYTASKYWSPRCPSNPLPFPTGTWTNPRERLVLQWTYLRLDTSEIGINPRLDPRSILNYIPRLDKL